MAYVDGISVPIVQELIKSPNFSIPKSYTDPNQETQTILDQYDTLQNVPTVDFQLLLSNETRDLELQKMHSFCKEWGFFQVVNHGINTSVMEMMRNEVEGFFNLPMEEKMKYKVREDDYRTEGYGDIKKPNTRFNWADRFFMLTDPVSVRKPYLYPCLYASLRTATDGYLREMKKFTTELLGSIAKNLNVEKKEMDNIFEGGVTGIKMNYYPPCPNPELVNGCRPHTDGTAITILDQMNGVDGLQVMRNGAWFHVPIPSDALGVVIGDIFEVLSNGLYKSSMHRAVVNKERERISFGYLVNPRPDRDVAPLDSLISPENPPKFTGLNTLNYCRACFSAIYQLKQVLEQMTIDDEGVHLIKNT